MRTIFKDPNRLPKIQALIPELDQVYQDYALKHHFPGYCYALMVDGKLLHTQCKGYTELNHKIPVTSKTIFRIASMTKSFTAMAILQLRDAEKLRLEDPLYLYLPDLRGQKLTSDALEITIQDLLLHASGLPTDNTWADHQLEMTASELLAIIHKGLSFSTATDTAYEYSNLGYAILGYIINQVSGLSHQQYITEHILQPTGMRDAYWDYTQVPKAKLAHGYRWQDNTWQEEVLLGDGIFAAIGGLLVSIEDFSHYVALHQQAWPARNERQKGSLNRGLIRSMHQSRIFSRFQKDYTLLDGSHLDLIKGYGYGLSCNRDTHARTYVGHSGGLPGFGSNWIMMPDYGIALILLANRTYAPAYDVNFQVLHTLIQKAALEPRVLEPSQGLTTVYKPLKDLLPHWSLARHHKLFASNFFLDHRLEDLKRESEAHFDTIGPLIEWGTLVPQNALSAYFIVKGEKGSLKISFGLSPEHGAQIQDFSMESMQKS
jgi:CubicO group peptidase (beta-lactamase class C family)